MADQPTGGPAAPAQPAQSPVPLDDEAKALKLAEIKATSRKAIAEADKSTVEAQKATLAAQLPTNETKPLEGKIELGEKTGLIADLLAHSLVADGSKAIVSDVADELDPGVSVVLVVEDRNLTKLDWPYQAIKRQVDQQRASLRAALDLFADIDAPPFVEDVPPPPPPPSEFLLVAGLVGVLPAASALLTAAPAAVGAVAAVAGMFRSDYSITNRDVAIGTTPLVAAVTGELLKGDFKVVNRDFELVAGSRLASRFWDAWRTRAELERRKTLVSARTLTPADLRIESLRAQWTAAQATLDKLLAEEDGASPGPLREEVDRLRTEVIDEQRAVAEIRGRVSAAESAITRFDAFATSVTATTADAAYPPLVAAAIQERLRRGDARVTHVLYVGLEGAGGETVTSRNLFRGSRLAYVGGVQISHLLLDVDARVTTAGGTESLLARVRHELSDGSLSGRTVTSVTAPVSPSEGRMTPQRLVILASVVAAAVAVLVVAVLEATAT
jgi:hypothetical protein